MGPHPDTLSRRLASALHYATQVGGGIALFLMAAGAGWATAVACLLAGWTTGSFAEYALHRWCLHGMPAFSRVHARHHAWPTEEQLDPVSYFSPFGFHLAAWLLVWGVTGRVEPAHAVVAGGFLQYAWFRAMHRHLHTRRARRGTDSLAEFHRVHHIDPGCNFGVSTRFWDRLFGSGIRHG